MMKYVPVLFEVDDYEKFYGTIDYKDKVVLELGADRGSTAWFFLEKGAKKIISIERDDIYFSELCYNIEDDERVIPIHIEINNSIYLPILIRFFKPDILHSDCEGGERFLLDVDDSLFSTVKIYQIEVHGYELHERIIEKLNRLKYEISMDDNWILHSELWMVVARRIE